MPEKTISQVETSRRPGLLCLGGAAPTPNVGAVMTPDPRRDTHNEDVVEPENGRGR